MMERSMRVAGCALVCVLAATLAASCASSDYSTIDASASGGDGGGPGPDGGPAMSDAPPGVEVCDGMDNDGDQFVDEGTAEELCGAPANGTPACRGLGGCAIDACTAGYLDLDGLFSTGCECGQEAGEAGPIACDQGIDLGPLADTNSAIEIVGNLAPAGDEDWYRFLAVDTPDTTCDAFHVRVLFLENPGDEFEVDVFRGGCAGTQICESTTDMQWFTNHQVPGSPPTGQCPCTDPAVEGNITTNQCLDDGAEFAVRVRRTAGAPVSCNSYRIELSNGRYPPP